MGLQRSRAELSAFARIVGRFWPVGSPDGKVLPAYLPWVKRCGRAQIAA